MTAKPAGPTEPSAAEGDREGRGDGDFGLSIRAGYYYDMAPVRKKTLSPDLPDADRHGLSVGLGFRWRWLRLDAAYLAVIFEETTKRNDIGGFEPRVTIGHRADGNYKNFAHVFCTGLGISF